MRCQRCQKEAMVLTPLPDSSEHVCEECYAEAYRSGAGRKRRGVGIAVACLLAAGLLGGAIWAILTGEPETGLAPGGGTPRASPAPSVSKAPRAKSYRKPTRSRHPPRRGPAARTKTSPTTPVPASERKPGPGAEAKVGPEKGAEPAAGRTKEAAEKKETQEAAARPEAENAYVRVAAVRTSTRGTIEVKYVVPSESEEEPPTLAGVSLTPSNGTFFALELEVEPKAGDSMSLGEVALTFEGGTHYPVQWQAFGAGFRGASVEDLVIGPETALEIDLTAEEPDVFVEGAGGVLSRSAYLRPAEGGRVPVTLVFDVPSAPTGLGVLTVAGLSMDIDFARLGR